MLLFAASVVFIITGAITLAKNLHPAPAVAFLFALVFIGCGFFWVAPNELGRGHVSDSVATISSQLEKRVQYEILASKKDKEAEIVWVEKTGCGSSDCYRIIRIKEDDMPTSKFFLLGDDGVPLADGHYIPWPTPEPPACWPPETKSK